MYIFWEILNSNILNSQNTFAKIKVSQNTQLSPPIIMHTVYALSCFVVSDDSWFYPIIQGYYTGTMAMVSEATLIMSKFNMSIHNTW